MIFGGVIPINIIGKSIKTHRKRAGLTQQKLSGQLGVHEITIRRWETGVREPRSSDIKALCEVLQVTESELLNGPKVSELKINIIWEVDDQMNELAIKANEFGVGLRQVTKQERERAELAMYEYKKKARELEAQLQAVRSTPAPQPVVEVREVVPDDVKARLEEREAELKKLQETLEVEGR